MSGCIPHLSISHSPVFLLNSCLDLFSAPPSLEDPLSRSYGVNLPSSLTMNHSSASVFSTRPRVSVSSTGVLSLVLRGFSREPVYHRYPIVRGLSVLSASPFSADLPTLNLTTAFNGRFRRPAGVSLLRLPIAAETSNGILTVSSIGFGSRLILRSRLTLIRLALIRKPWSYGEGVSRPLYRYLYLHLLFQQLQTGSTPSFFASGMLPYRLASSANPTSSAPGLCPIIIHARPLD